MEEFYISPGNPWRVVTFFMAKKIVVVNSDGRRSHPACCDVGVRPGFGRRAFYLYPVLNPVWEGIYLWKY
jgi:hypothetical protein